MWCVKSTFMYCYESVFKLEPLWKKEHVRVEKYTKMALLLNGNIATFWNLRKKLISSHLLDASSDLLLTKLVLSYKPKTVEALTHRRWLLQTQPKEAGWMEKEMMLCNQLANRMKCNYHAWSHRQWIFALDRFNLNLWQSEFQLSEEWTKFHLSDHSGWHYRKFLLEQLKKNADCLREVDGTATAVISASQFYLNLLKEELRKNEELILSFSAHETLWYYRRFLLQGLQLLQQASWAGSEAVFLDQFTCQNPNNNKNRIYLDNHRRWLSSYLV